MSETESTTSFRERAAKHYDRRGLPKRLRHLVFVSVLTLLGRSRDLEESLRWALDRRVGLDLVHEAILQTMLFGGYPRAIHAFEVLDEVLRARGLEPSHRRDRLPPRSTVKAFFRRRGRDLFLRVYREDADRVIERISGFHPEFMDWILEDAYGKVLARPFLDSKARELLACALLASLDLPPQLASHVRGALRAGAKMREVEEAIRQLQVVLPSDHVARALHCARSARGTA